MVARRHLREKAEYPIHNVDEGPVRVDATRAWEQLDVDQSYPIWMIQASKGNKSLMQSITLEHNTRFPKLDLRCE